MVFKDGSQTGYSDFTNDNNHLFGSTFMIAFITSVGMLEFMGNANMWTIEGASASYTPNTSDEPWRGWHHVYSACKAGRGQKHKPQVNKLGNN